MHGARVPTVGACSVAVVSTAFNLPLPTPATLEDIGQQMPWNSIRELLETYCHGDSFARWSIGFALTVGRWTRPTAQNVARVILFVSVGMRKL
jgi:hypothetical protein